MFSKFDTPMKFRAIFSLVLILAVSIAFAANYYGTSFVVKKGKGHKTEYLVRDGKDKIGVMVKSQSLDAYMEEQAISSVNITVDLVEQWVETDTGGHYRLEFTFGPSGAFFIYPLELYLIGKYSSPDTSTLIYDENGEMIENWSQSSGQITTFYIPHFSSYSYDFYEY